MPSPQTRLPIGPRTTSSKEDGESTGAPTADGKAIKLEPISEEDLQKLPNLSLVSIESLCQGALPFTLFFFRETGRLQVGGSSQCSLAGRE